MPRDAYAAPSSSPAPAARQRGRWIPWMFVLAFAVVSAANATMVYFATSTFTGVAVDKPFERGVAYNKLLAAAQAEAQLGWVAETAIEKADDGGGGALTIGILAKGAILDGAAVSGRLHRVLEPMADQPLSFSVRSPGRFSADLTGVKPGQWDLIMVVQRGTDRLHVTRRLCWSDARCSQ